MHNVITKFYHLGRGGGGGRKLENEIMEWKEAKKIKSFENLFFS